MEQLTLIDDSGRAKAYRACPLGATYDADRDGERLKTQQERVEYLMKDGQWRTFAEIAKVTKDPEASISARLRQMRRDGYRVEREFVHRGLHRYRAVKA